MGKRGPASLFKPDYCSLARKFCILGATNENLAELFEVSVASSRVMAACSSSIPSASSRR